MDCESVLKAYIKVYTSRFSVSQFARMLLELPCLKLSQVANRGNSTVNMEFYYVIFQNNNALKNARQFCDKLRRVCPFLPRD